MHGGERLGKCMRCVQHVVKVYRTHHWSFRHPEIGRQFSAEADGYLRFFHIAIHVVQMLLNTAKRCNLFDGGTLRPKFVSGRGSPQHGPCPLVF